MMTADEARATVNQDIPDDADLGIVDSAGSTDSQTLVGESEPSEAGHPAAVSVDPAASDWPGAAEADADSSATDDASPSASSTPALPAAFQPAPRTSSVSTGFNHKHGSPARPFTAPALDAGDVARALCDFTPEQVVEAIAENATPAQKQALRAAFGGQPAAPATEPATERRALRDVKALIREHLSSADIRLLESELPMIRKEVGARERSLVANGTR